MSIFMRRYVYEQSDQSSGSFSSDPFTQHLTSANTHPLLERTTLSCPARYRHCGHNIDADRTRGEGHSILLSSAGIGYVQALSPRGLDVGPAMVKEVDCSLLINLLEQLKQYGVGGVGRLVFWQGHLGGVTMQVKSRPIMRCRCPAVTSELEGAWLEVGVRCHTCCK